jgi:hypothetical protein
MEEVKPHKLNLQMFTGKINSITPIHNFFCNLFSCASVTIMLCVFYPAMHTKYYSNKITTAIELTITNHPLPAPPNQKKGQPQNKMLYIFGVPIFSLSIYQGTCLMIDPYLAYLTIELHASSICHACEISHWLDSNSYQIYKT